MSNGEKTPKRAVQIAPAGPVHAHLLAALHAECFEDPWTGKAFSSLLGTPGTLAWTACDKQTDRPVGFILLRAVAEEAEILSIGVIPDARGQAVGAKLIHAAGLLEGLKTLFLDVAEDNHNALRLYQREGFEIVGRRSGYYAREGGIRVDSLTMKRDLR